MEELVYLNGAFIPRHEARIAAMDYGFLYGYGLFETMRAYNGKVFRLESHLGRLTTSARLLKIPVETGALKKAVIETVRLNGLKEARVRLTVSIGEGNMVPNPQSCLEPTVLVAAARYTPYPQEVYDRGFRAIISSLYRNSRSPVSGMKTTNYLESLLSREEAKEAQADEAILLNEKGEVAEASTSNVFLVSPNILRTPPIGRNFAGSNRGIVLEVALK
jgi:branched-chain amino acid aminotransferase